MEGGVERSPSLLTRPIGQCSKVEVLFERVGLPAEPGRLEERLWRESMGWSSVRVIRVFGGGGTGSAGRRLHSAQWGRWKKKEKNKRREKEMQGRERGGSPYLLLVDARRRHPPESLALARQVTHNRHHPVRTRPKSTNEVRAVDLCLATDEGDVGRGQVGLVPRGCGSVEGCFVRCVRGEAREFVLGQRAAGGGLCGCGRGWGG